MIRKERRTVGGSAKRTESTIRTAIRDERQARPVNEYYAGIAKKYNYAKYAAIVLLAVFLVYVFAAYGDKLTYDNLLYIIKDFSTESTGAGAVFDTIRFEGRERAQYGIYSGELAVTGNGGVALYSKNGNRTLKYYTAYAEPMMKLSDKYILVYDLGGKDYSLYTSLARVVSRSADHTIMGGDVSDSGAYALITRSSTSKFKVNVYSASLNLAWTYYKDSYVADIALSGDGKNIVVASYDISGYDYSAEIALCSVKDDKPISTAKYTGICPYRVAYLKDGSFSAVCDTCILFFDSDGRQTGRFDYGGTLSALSESGGYTVAVISDTGVNGKDTLVLLNEVGSVVYRTVYDDRITDVSMSENYTVYLITQTEVVRITPDFITESREYAAGADRIIALDGYALAISETKAESVFTALGK